MELIIKPFCELTLDELYQILKLRVDVFVVEQTCPYHELDDKDQNAYHVFFRENGTIKAYLRVLDKGVSFREAAIGRVVTRARRNGLGSRILSAGIQTAKDVYGAEKIILEAQTYARGFYEKAGFRQVSDEFLEDGIPHIKMLLDLTQPASAEP